MPPPDRASLISFFAMRARPVPSVLVGVALVLLAQYGAVGLFGGHGEPWPALVMPAFQSSWRLDEDVVFDRVHLALHTEEGEWVTVLLGDLLDALPATHHPAIARAHFACDGSPPSADLARWLRDRLQALHPILSPVQLSVSWETVAVPLAEGTRHARTEPGASCSIEV